MALRVRNLKVFLALGVLFAIVVLVVAPAMYFYTLSQLPALESEFDLERVLRQNIESERRSYQLGLYDKSGYQVEFPRPTLNTLPKNLVATYITERGCPYFFQTPREQGFAWGRRMVAGLFGMELAGDGWCEQLFAANLAHRIGAKGNLEVAVATHRIHAFLEKDAVIAYDLASVPLATGIVGVDSGARALMKKSLEQLTTAEIAELALALPPNGFWQAIKDCQNPTLLRQGRDNVVRRLTRAGLIPETEGKAAVAQPLACTRSE